VEGLRVRVRQIALFCIIEKAWICDQNPTISTVMGMPRPGAARYRTHGGKPSLISCILTIAECLVCPHQRRRTCVPVCDARS
jgi:hypothetical protein